MAMTVSFASAFHVVASPVVALRTAMLLLTTPPTLRKFPPANTRFPDSARVNPAEAAGLTCTVGSNLELGIGSAAMTHLAIATPGIGAEKFACDIIGPMFYEDDIVKEPLPRQQVTALVHCTLPCCARAKERQNLRLPQRAVVHR